MRGRCADCGKPIVWTRDANSRSLVALELPPAEAFYVSNTYEQTEGYGSVTTLHKRHRCKQA